MIARDRAGVLVHRRLYAKERIERHIESQESREFREEQARVIYKDSISQIGVMLLRGYHAVWRGMLPTHVVTAVAGDR